MSALEVEPVDVPEPVTLHGEDVLRARCAVRKALADYRGNYSRSRRRGDDHYAVTALRRFDNYLDLYERLGGDSDDIPDPEDAPVRGDR